MRFDDFWRRSFLLGTALVLLSVFTLPASAQELLPFKRGDCDRDGNQLGVVGDAVYQLTWSFLNGPEPKCRAACDNDIDGIIGGNVSDAVIILNFNFLGGGALPAPFPDCGPSELQTDLDLGCEEYPNPAAGDVGCPRPRPVSHRPDAVS